MLLSVMKVSGCSESLINCAFDKKGNKEMMRNKMNLNCFMGE